MTAADWDQIDATVTTLPTTVTETDLFGADLFGTELIDMYSSSTDVDAGNESSRNNNPHVENDSQVVNTAESAQPAESAHNNDNENDPSPVSALDGLGSLQPSTSFNEFTDLLPPVAPTSSSVPQAASANGQHVPKKRSLEEISTSVTMEQSKPITSIPITTTATPAVNTATPVSQALSATISKKKNSRRKNSGNCRNGIISPSAVLSSNSITGQAAAFIMRQKQLGNQGISTTASGIISPLTSTVTTENRNGTTTPPVDNSAPSVVTPIVSTPIVNTPTTSSVPYVQSDSATATAAAVAAAVRPKTEADFAAVAQAAVSSLILSAGATAAAQHFANHASTDEESDAPITAVDTSTAHITALTSSNWMAACNTSSSSPSSNPVPPPSPVSSPLLSSASQMCSGSADGYSSEPANKKRRENLTPDERAKQNRVRNREHARNTRLRKKAYVEELKRTLTELVAQRDAAELERRHTAQRELEQREVRFRVMEEFLRLRGSNEPNVSRWVAILEDEFALSLPLTRYRAMVNVKSGTPDASLSSSVPTRVLDPMKGSSGIHPHASSGEGHEQVLRGATEVMTDAGLVASHLQASLGVDLQTKATRPVCMVYDCNRKRFYMDGCTAMLDWTATTVGGVHLGMTAELTIKGAMKAIFSPASNKLISAELIFDTGIVQSQLKNLNPTTVHATTITREAMHSDLVSSDGMSAKEADELLDSIQMPCLNGMVSNQDLASVTASEKSEGSLDETETSDYATAAIGHHHHHHHRAENVVTAGGVNSQ